MGGFFGVVGMVIGVPSFAIIYMLIKKIVEARLAKKALPTETEYYFKKDIFDIETNQLSFEKQVLAAERNEDEGVKKQSLLAVIKSKFASLRKNK
jgi:hypothetical protein